MFNFLKNLFKPKNTEGPHPLDGPVRAATEKAKLPEPPIVTPMFIPPVEPKPVEAAPAPVAATPAPIVAEANHTVWPFPVSAPEATPEVKKEKKPRKPRAPKAVAMTTQPKKKK